MRETTKCDKFVGASTIELIRNKLLSLALNVSNRDIFIQGVPHELDLLIAKNDVKPIENVLYLPPDVLVVFEIKFRGCYGKPSLNNVKEVFDSVKKVNDKIECFYATVSENSRYKYRATYEKLGYECFELLTRETNLERALSMNSIRTTGDWQKLLSRLSAHIKQGV